MSLLHVSFFSNALREAVSMDVLLPDFPCYPDAPAPRKYPVLYLLHGLSDDQTIWQRRTRIESYVAGRDLIVVMPTTHRAWYTNTVSGLKYFDFIAREVPAFCRANFPVAEGRENTFVAGLSMGGAGCMKIGLARPENYAAIGCLSAGAINRRRDEEMTPERRARNEMLYGDRDLTGTEEDVFGNAERILSEGKPVPRIYHACGSEDFLLPSALETRDFFSKIPGNPFDYTFEQDPGAHTWEFWDEHIQRFLSFLRLDGGRNVCN